MNRGAMGSNKTLALSNTRLGMRGWGQFYPLQEVAVRVGIYNYRVKDLARGIGGGTWGCLSISGTLKGCRRYAISGSGTILSRLSADMFGGVNKGLSVGIKASESGL
jgi:hypothetical protein